MITISSKFFLTESKKKKILSDLILNIEEKQIDKELIPYLNKINRIEGIATIYCCVGHNDYKLGYILCQVSEKVFRSLLCATNSNEDIHLDLFDSNKHKYGGFFHESRARALIRWNSKKEMKKKIKYLIESIEGIK